ncbi:MAG TPA: hypothetical protein VN791_02680 [Acidimicrobiales bacterium]|nr:hypothetical protein [Acidimicrobiales bacterium]
MPLHESALARYDEAQEARERLLASLEELRRRADNFLTVAASTTTMLATLARADPYLGPSPDDVSATATAAPVSDPTPPGRTPPTATGTVDRTCPATAPRPGAPYPDGARRRRTAPYPDGVRGPAAPYPDAECAIGTADPVVPRAITSPNLVELTTGRPFSFTVTTTGTPVASLTERGERPNHFIFADNGDGTAILWGTPRKAGVYHISFRATFGRGPAKYLVIQAVTLMVVSNG